MPTFNHAFDVCFEIAGSKSEDASDVTAAQARAAITKRLESMSDEELLAHMGAPFDTHEEAPKVGDSGAD